MTDERVQWDSSLSFLLAMIGSAVGLGNIWRFPYVAYTNGAGAFMIPYVIAILFVGVPFIFVEYGAGYKFKAGLSKILRKINKKYEYIAWFIQMIPFLILTYYTCIMAWDLIYLLLSFFKGWGSNPDSFFTNTVLQNSNSLMGMTHLVLPVLAAIIVIWAIIWFISHRDLNSGIAKANKILMPLLFIMMAGIVVYSFTLPGSNIGRIALFTPNWAELTNVNIWLAAFGQIVFSLSLGLCIMLTYASYLPDDTDLVGNGLIVAFTNSGFEVFSAIGVFGILGYMSVSTGIPLSNVVTQGTGLAFVAFPSVFNTMGSVGYIIGPIFFLCLFSAGITSAISLVEPISASLTEKFDTSRKKTVTFIVLAGFLISLLYTTAYGSSILGIFDGFLNKFGLLLTMIMECVIFGWIYNLDNLLEAINRKSRLKLGTTWKLIIKYLIPIIVGILWIEGNIESFTSGNIISVVTQLILLAVLLTVPIIFTRLPAKVKNY